MAQPPTQQEEPREEILESVIRKLFVLHLGQRGDIPIEEYGAIVAGAAVEALATADKRYDPARGTKKSTLAVWIGRNLVRNDLRAVRTKKTDSRGADPGEAPAPSSEELTLERLDREDVRERVNSVLSQLDERDTALLWAAYEANGRQEVLDAICVARGWTSSQLREELKRARRRFREQWRRRGLPGM